MSVSIKELALSDLSIHCCTVHAKIIRFLVYSKLNNLRAYSKRGYFETCECVFFCVGRIRTRISLFTDECGRGCAVL